MQLLPDSDEAARLWGVLKGTAVGDSIGLPAEGLSRDRIRRRWHGVWRHRLFFGCGTVSDDADHAFLVAQCLIEHPRDVHGFTRALARRLRLWLIALPAGIGFATGRAIAKLWLGIPPARSGVSSAGNGPLMRAAIIGAFFWDEPQMRRSFILASTKITHTDERAVIGALAVADIAAAARAGIQDDATILQILRDVSPDSQWLDLVSKIEAAGASGMSVSDFADSLGLRNGITGFVFHTAPVAIYAWWRHRGDFERGMIAVLDCGGDTDSVGAVFGGMCGADKESTIPDAWIDGIVDWPRSMSWARKLAPALELAKQGTVTTAPSYFWPAVPLRNALFFMVVIVHGLSRPLFR